MAHPAKRPYTGSQPSITSYFTTQDPYALASSPTTYSNIPVLPPVVQSNLLQVGMRVRKSVPEGYKTGSPYSGFSLFADNNPVTASSTNQNQIVASGQEKSKPKTRPRAGARELTPFCGLLKVGGLAQQQWGVYAPNYDGSMIRDREAYAAEAEEGFADGEDGEMEDEGSGMELPWSSQESGSTVSSYGEVVTPGGTNKRRYFEEIEDENTGIVFSGAMGMGNALGERVLAVPRRKKWVGSAKFNGGGQENVGIVGEDVDFDEAEFLDYGLIKEVEMGGC
jgi:hypothetical protein